MAKKDKNKFRTALEKPLSEVDKSQAALEFEEVAKERSIKKAAERLGTTPDALKQEAGAKGVNVLDLVRDKEPKAETVQEKIKKNISAPAPVAEKPGPITPVAPGSVKQAVDAARKQGKSVGEALEQVAKKIPDKRSKLAFGILGAAISAAALTQDTKKEPPPPPAATPTPPATEPTPPPAPVKTEDKIPPGAEKIEQLIPDAKKYEELADNATKETLKTPRELLEDKYQSAIDAYKAGADRVEIAKAIEKIAQGFALWGAGAYGMKHGVDAVSGLKFSPTDWSTRMAALETELNAAEKRYSKGIEAIEEEEKTARQEQRDLSRLDKMIAAEQERADKEQEKMLRTATVGDIQANIKDMDTQVKNIDNALNQMKTAQFGKMDDSEKENALLAAATGAGVPIESMRKEKGMLFWKGQKFDEDTARRALINKKTALQNQKDAAQNRLLEVRSGGQGVSGNATVPEPAPVMIKVKAGGRIGQIPRNQFDAVKQKYPDAEIVQ